MKKMERGKRFLSSMFICDLPAPFPTSFSDLFSAGSGSKHAAEEESKICFSFTFCGIVYLLLPAFLARVGLSFGMNFSFLPLLLVLFVLPATSASRTGMVQKLSNLKRSLRSIDIAIASYYFPEKIRKKLEQDYVQNETVDSPGLAELAQAEGINRDIFSKAIILFKTKMSFKKLLNIRETVPRGEIGKIMDRHYEENFKIITDLGFEKEMIGEMYYACKVLMTWSPAMAWRLSSVLLNMMHSHTRLLLGPITHEELWAYKLDQVKVYISATDRVRSYMECFPESKEEGTLSKRLYLASNFEKCEDYIFLASLLNPYDFDPQYRKNVYEHILGLQQWKRLHELRMVHVNKEPHAPLEKIILSTGTNAHYQLLLKSCESLPKKVSLMIQKHFTSAFASLLSDSLEERDEVQLSNSSDVNLRRKLAAHQNQAMFGLPGPLRVLFFMRIQEDFDGWYSRFIDTEFFMTCAQCEIFNQLTNDETVRDLADYADDYFPDEEFGEVCLEWLKYWSFLVRTIGQVMHQTSSSEVLHKMVEDYFSYYFRPPVLPTGEYVKAIESAIQVEGNLFVALAKMFGKDRVTIMSLIECFSGYENALREVLIQEGLPLFASEANKIQLTIVMHSITKQ